MKWWIWDSSFFSYEMFLIALRRVHDKHDEMFRWELHELVSISQKRHLATRGGEMHESWLSFFYYSDVIYTTARNAFWLLSYGVISSLQMKKVENFKGFTVIAFWLFIKGNIFLVDLHGSSESRFSRKIVHRQSVYSSKAFFNGNCLQTKRKLYNYVFFKLHNFV